MKFPKHYNMEWYLSLSCHGFYLKELNSEFLFLWYKSSLLVYHLFSWSTVFSEVFFSLKRLKSWVWWYCPKSKLTTHSVTRGLVNFRGIRDSGSLSEKTVYRWRSTESLWCCYCWWDQLWACSHVLAEQIHLSCRWWKLLSSCILGYFGRFHKSDEILKGIMSSFSLFNRK